MSDDGTSVDTGDGWDTLACTPIAQTLNGSPVAVLKSCICDNDTGGLDVGGLEVFEESVLIPGRGRDTVVSNQWLGEDKDLSTV